MLKYFNSLLGVKSRNNNTGKTKANNKKYGYGFIFFMSVRVSNIRVTGKLTKRFSQPFR